jgi:uncharacterized Zn finger protein
MSGRVELKARFYLSSGRLTITRVDARRIIATCVGSAPDPYDVEWTEGLWRCSCPALRRCAHLAALQLATCPMAEREAGTGELA